MGFLSEDELQSMGFRKLGKHVKISDKASIYDADQMEIGDHSRVDDFCVLSGRILLSRNVHIAVFCNLAGGEAGIEIDAFSGLAYGATVFTQNDDYSGETLLGPTIPEKYRQQTDRGSQVEHERDASNPRRQNAIRIIPTALNPHKIEQKGGPPK